MKILHVISSMNPIYGGPSQGIRNFEFGLRDKNIERHIVCFDSPEEVNRWENGSLIIHPLGKRITPWQFNSKLSDWLDANVVDYNVLIINGLWLYHSYIAIKVINSLKENKQKVPKVFIMPHGMLDPWFQKAKSRRFKAIRNEVYWRLIEKKVVNSADGLLFTCEEELRLARQSFKGYRPQREVNIGYGIQEPPVQTDLINKALEEIYPSYQNNKYWLFLSRINEKKGVDLLIEAYQKLIEENNAEVLPDLLIAGPGIESDFGKKILLLGQKSIQSRKKIHFIGMLSGDSKWGAIHNCELLILPSHQENFGIVIAEALACSKPVLISRQVNIWYEIQQAKAGIICDDNSLSVFNALKEFHELNGDEKQNMSKQARLAFEQYFDVRKTAQKFVDAIS
jgi:glycosyltransferase involved in cell wall biosynthesis